MGERCLRIVGWLNLRMSCEVPHLGGLARCFAKLNDVLAALGAGKVEAGGQSNNNR